MFPLTLSHLWIRDLPGSHTGSISLRVVLDKTLCSVVPRPNRDIFVTSCNSSERFLNSIELYLEKMF